MRLHMREDVTSDVVKEDAMRDQGGHDEGYGEGEHNEGRRGCDKGWHDEDVTRDDTKVCASTWLNAFLFFFHISALRMLTFSSFPILTVNG
jgi:hypothetical protein